MTCVHAILATVRRQATALAAGTAVGVIAQECVWRGLDAFAFNHDLDRALAHFELSPLLLISLAASGLFGGLMAGLMATLIGRSRAAGLTTGILLSGSAGLLMFASGGAYGGMIALAGIPFAGAVAGSSLAHGRLRAHGMD